MFAARLLPPVMSLIFASRKGVVSLPWMPRERASSTARAMTPVDLVGIHRVLFRNGVGHQHAAGKPHLALDVEGLGQLLGGVETIVHLKPLVRV